jgi:hypothetical protein
MMILFVKLTKGIPVVHKFCQLMKSSPIAVDVQMRDTLQTPREKKRQRRQIHMVHKILHRKLKIEQHEMEFYSQHIS